MANGATPLSPATLQDTLLQAMASRGGTRRFPANAVLVNEADSGDAVFILLSGRVKVYGASADGREVVYTTMGPGEYFGELTLDGGPRSASVMTLEPCTCVVVPGAQMREFLGSHPEFALHLVHKLIGMVRQVTDTVKSLALDDVYSRLARLLNTLARPDDQGRLVVPERLTHQDLADRIGASREMVSRIVKQLMDGEYVRVEGRHYVLVKRLPTGF